MNVPESIHIIIAIPLNTLLVQCRVGCQGDECSKTFDLIRDNCQTESPGTGNAAPTLYPGMVPTSITNSMDCTCSIEDLIRAIRVQSILGAIIGLLSFTLVVVIIGWVRTYYLMVRGRGEARRNLHQDR